MVIEWIEKRLPQRHQGAKDHKVEGVLTLL
jgi:hypothetical protein